MKTILDLNSEEARFFFLRRESYSNIELPFYFTFQNLLNQISKKLDGKNLSDFRSPRSKPEDYDDINHSLITNKDGKYSWRAFQLIHPVIYVSLVHKITEEDNWNLIKEQFKKFQTDSKIECSSLPVVSSESEKTTSKLAQIQNWWQMIEQKSLTLSLDFKCALHTDITDCYGSIYTHSISWAIHTKEEAKKKKNRRQNSSIGSVIDKHLRDMSYGQTNGIPQGSKLMNFISEIVLGYADLLLSQELSKTQISKFKILRYRDDYRIFTNNSLEAELITKKLSEVLSGLGLRLNAGKTNASNDIIKSSIKPDKRYWINNKNISDNKQKWLIQLYLLSEKFPDSGTVDTQLKKFLTFLKKSKKKDKNLPTLISIVTEIGLRNLRVIPTTIAILSLFIDKIELKDEKLKIVNKIKAKFKQVPNSSFIMVWLQRLYLKIASEEYDEPLCKLVFNKEEKIWNSDWLKDSLKNVIDKTEVIDYKKVKNASGKISNKEIRTIINTKTY